MLHSVYLSARLVFASNSGHFRINDILLFFTPLLLLNYFLFNLFSFLQKSGKGGEGAAKALSAPPSARSLVNQCPGISQCWLPSSVEDSSAASSVLQLPLL